MTQYNLALKKFLNSQYLYTGVRITAGVLIPAILLYKYGLLTVMMGVPLGALFIALPDNPGPLHHRINGMIAGIIINFIVVIIAGYSSDSHMLVGIQVVLFTFLFAMFGVYGARADGIGLVALVAFIIAYGAGSFGHKQPPIYNAIYFAAGGAWYALLSLVFSGIQPYKPVQQLLGEYLIVIGEYLKLRSKFYDRSADVQKVLNELFPKQVVIQKHQGDLREMLFKTRLFVKESTNKGRRLVMIFLESTDLLERIITAQQNYTQLHKEFDDAGILEHFRKHIEFLGSQLEVTGAAVQGGESISAEALINSYVEESNNAFFSLRKEQLNASNMERFIRLRHILYSLTDLSERVKRLQTYTIAGNKVKYKVDEEYLQNFVTHQDFSIRHFTANLSINSGQFRHAIRLTVAMLVGYILSLLLPLGHGYWILLTIATILKPAFSASRSRNFQRVGGTLVGVGLGFLVLYLSKTDDTAIFIVMIAGMLIAYTTLRLNYLVSTAALTLYIVLSFHFLYHASLNGLLLDRIIDTITGAVVALLAAYFILPKWEHQQITQQLKDAVQANTNYFAAVADFFQLKDRQQVLNYKLSRKAAFISLANVSDGLQRMLNEPRSQQKLLPYYHQMVASNHMLTSYIASLAYYAEQHEGKIDTTDLKPMLQFINRQFDQLFQLLERAVTNIKRSDPFPISKKVQELLQLRKSELENNLGNENVAMRQKMSAMKAINDQLNLVNSVLEEQIRIVLRMNNEQLSTNEKPAVT